MPRPPLPKSSRLETTKAQASMIMPSKEDQPEESGEDDHTTFSPSSPDTEKKRSAFEDCTNTSQSQTVQSKKEDDTEHRSHASKRTSKGAAKISLRKRKARHGEESFQFRPSLNPSFKSLSKESYLPSLKRFLLKCKGPHEPRDMTSLEMKILKTLDFDISIPTAYNFLRRYATCIHASMKTLTLSRFICEITLPEYEFIQEKPSKLAAACLALTLYMRNLDNCIPLLEHYTHYKIRELYTLVLKLNSLVAFQPNCCLKNVYAKYSEENFFEVAKIPPLDMNYLEEILQCAL